jgi:TRAP-type C4-dicarboxylate transport system substrate-binding protein
MEKFASEVNKRTNGKVKIVIYPTGTLNPPFETFNSVKNGIADIGAAPVGYSPAIMPLNKLFGDAMMGVPSATQAAKIWNQAFNDMPELQKELEGVHVLWLYATTPLSIATTKTEIRKLEDFKGLILRFPPGLEPLAKAWGVSPINMPIGDIYVAMDKGSVGGFFGGSELLKTMKLADHTKKVTNMSMVYALSYVGVNQKVWDSLPAEVQKIFNDLGEWGQNLTIAAFDEADKQTVQYALSKKCEFIKINDVELQRIYSVSKPVFGQIAEGLEAKGKPAKKVLSKLEKLTSQAKQ